MTSVNESNRPYEAEAQEPVKGYDAWLREKVEEARTQVREAPEKLIPLEEMAKKYDL